MAVLALATDLFDLRARLGRMVLATRVDGSPITGGEAVVKYLSYGTEERVRTFGLGRAADCRDEWYAGGVTEYGLGDPEEIVESERAWVRWAESSDSFAAFAWGRAVGRLPGGPR